MGTLVSSALGFSALPFGLALTLYNTDRRGWRFRAFFSNTALAHRLGRTHDWVVISFHDGFVSGQRTVVTETVGDLRGRRVVRGRERECRGYYAALRDAGDSGCYDNRLGRILPPEPPRDVPTNSLFFGVDSF